MNDAERRPGLTLRKALVASLGDLTTCACFGFAIRSETVVERAGFEPAYGKPGQIYSLLPLTTRPPLQAVRRAKWLPPLLLSTALQSASPGTSDFGAGEGNRTLVVSLEGFCSTIELHPHFKPLADFRMSVLRSPLRSGVALKAFAHTEPPGQRLPTTAVDHRIGARFC